MNLTRIHIAAAVVALLSVLTLLGLALTSEISPDHLAAARRWIARGLFVLIPALIVTAATGHEISRGNRRGLVGDKMWRMKVAATNGLVVLVPCALFLAARAEAGDIGGAFRVVQGLELVAGAVNLTLLGLNFRDGMRLSGRLRRGEGMPVRVIRRA
jgi:hypothetical protein